MMVRIKLTSVVMPPTKIRLGTGVPYLGALSRDEEVDDDELLHEELMLFELIPTPADELLHEFPDDTPEDPPDDVPDPVEDETDVPPPVVTTELLHGLFMITPFMMITINQLLTLTMIIRDEIEFTAIR